MKKITLLAFICFIANNIMAQDTFTVFNTRSEFLNACPMNMLTFEDFEGGPASTQACDGPISSVGDNCFAANEIQSGVEITASGGKMIIIPAGSFGVNNPTVGADAFVATTIINFTGNDIVNAVAFDLYSALTNTQDIIRAKIYGQQGIIDSLDFNVFPDQAYFVGLTSKEPIVKIELENLDLVLENVALLLYGECNIVSSIEETNFAKFNFFPNPAQNTLNLKNDIPIQSISVYDVLGKKIMTDNIESKTFNIDVSEFQQGIYFLEAVIDNTPKRFQFIKNK